MNRIVLFFLFLLIGLMPAYAEQTPIEGVSDRTVSVVGEGFVTEKPDIVLIEFTVFAENAVSSAAMNDLTQKVNSALQELQGQGITSENIKTLSVSLEPVYVVDRTSNKEVLETYRAKESFLIKADVTAAGNLLEVISPNGTVNRVSFHNSNIEKLKLDAIKLAMDDARNQAMASLSGTAYKISGIKSVEIFPVSGNSTDKAMFAPGLASQPLRVEGGKDTVRMMVRVTFTVEQ